MAEHKRPRGRKTFYTDDGKGVHISQDAVNTGKVGSGTGNPGAAKTGSSTIKRAGGGGLGLLIIVALSGPLHAFCHACYFTIRSGGKTFITFLFDSAYMWVVSIPLAWALSSFTTLPILPIYAVCQFIDVSKCAIGAFLLKKGIWIQNIVNEA